MLPFAGVNPRGPLRPSMSISDASEQGGGVAEAVAIVDEFSVKKSDLLQICYSRLNKESVEFATRKLSPMCVCVRPARSARMSLCRAAPSFAAPG